MLDELVVVRRELEEPRWAEWITESARRLRADDFSGITHLLSAYGGMGSFSEGFRTVVGGAMEARAVRAEQLSSEAYQLANEIRREVESA